MSTQYLLSILLYALSIPFVFPIKKEVLMHLLSAIPENILLGWKDSERKFVEEDL